MAWLAALRSVGGMSDEMTSRSAAQADCQVLIVGAGPTGLMLAAQLLARGVATRTRVGSFSAQVGWHG